MPWVTIPNSVFEAGKPARAIDMRNLRDNFAAMAEGASGAPSIQDAALDTGAATAAGIAWVGLRMAAASVGGVGSYALLRFVAETGVGAVQGPGTTHAGSNLVYSPGNGSSAATAPSGTWRLMGRTVGATGGGSVSLFVRIS